MLSAHRDRRSAAKPCEEEALGGEGVVQWVRGGLRERRRGTLGDDLPLDSLLFRLTAGEKNKDYANQGLAGNTGSSSP